MVSGFGWLHASGSKESYFYHIISTISYYLYHNNSFNSFRFLILFAYSRVFFLSTSAALIPAASAAAISLSRLSPTSRQSSGVRFRSEEHTSELQSHVN